jgi:cell division protein FtsZ
MMSEFIRNLDVSFEIVSPAKGIDLLRQKEVQQPKAIERQEELLFPLIYRYASHNRFRK